MTANVNYTLKNRSNSHLSPQSKMVCLNHSSLSEMKIIDFKGSRYDPCVCVYICKAHVLQVHSENNTKCNVFISYSGQKSKSLLFKKISTFSTANLFLKKERRRNMEGLLSHLLTEQRTSKTKFTHTI